MSILLLGALALFYDSKERIKGLKSRELLKVFVVCSMLLALVGSSEVAYPYAEMG